MRIDNFRILLVAATIVVTVHPGQAHADDPVGGDGDPGYDQPQPPSTDPVVIALNHVPQCGLAMTGPVDWDTLLAEITAEELVLSIENGNISRMYLDRAISGLAAIGTTQDFRYVIEGAEDMSWEYLAEAVDEDASVAEVNGQQLHLAATIRGQMIWAWSREGEVPTDVLMAALWDPSPVVASKAVYIALQSEDDAVYQEALEVCDVDESVGAMTSLCPGT